MPNGIMTGSGSRANPWIVEDGWDFNALRNIPAVDASSVAFVELGANINLSMFDNFVPIPSRWFNIDGKGFIISDFLIQSTNTSEAGLFAQLNVTEYARNIVLEGVVHFNTSISFSRVGLLAGMIWCRAANIIIENIEAFGEVMYTLLGGTITP
ncbi:MAG: hypothetical protein FWD82_04945 [Defluviitaleaceae bacterium]|nr:hypothetical protein [Defluviitaleaceae bacterium]